MLVEDWQHPAESKPIELGSAEGQAPVATAYAAGHEAAGDLAEELVPRWLSLLRWLAGDRDSSIGLLAWDQVWDSDRRWLDLGDALRLGVVPPVGIELRPTKAGAVDGALVTLAQLERLLTVWWPSAAGGMTLIFGDSDGDASQFGHTLEGGEITASALRSARHVVQVASAFDHLGFVILSRDEPWERIERSLDVLGWTDGAPLETITPILP